MPPEAKQKHGTPSKLQDAAYVATNTLGLLFDKIRSAARRWAGPHAADDVASRIYVDLLRTLTKPRGGVFKPLDELFGPADDPRGMRGYITTQARFAARDEAKAMRRQTGAPVEIMKTAEEENERRAREGLPPMTAEEEASWREREKRHRTTHAQYDPEATAGTGHGTRGTARDPMMKPEDQPTTIGGSPFETPMRAALEREKRDLVFQALSGLRKQGEKGRRFAELLSCRFGFQRHEQPTGEDISEMPTQYPTMQFTYEPGTSVGMRPRSAQKCAGLWQMIQFNRYRQQGHKFFGNLAKQAQKLGLSDNSVRQLTGEIIPRAQNLAQEMQKQMNILRPLVEKLQQQKDAADEKMVPLDKKRTAAKKAVSRAKDDKAKKVAAEEQLKQIEAQIEPIKKVRDGANEALKRTIYAFPFQKDDDRWQNMAEGLPEAVEKVDPNYRPLAEDLLDRRHKIKRLVDEQNPAMQPIIKDMKKALSRAEKDEGKPLTKALRIRSLKDMIDDFKSFGTVFKPISADQVTKWITEAKDALGKVVLTFKHPDGTIRTMPFKDIVSEYAKLGRPETRGKGKGKGSKPLKGGLGK
jgi:chorismate mutase